MPQEPREEQSVEAPKDERPRIERIRACGEEPAMPDNPAPYLTDWLFQIGPAMPGGMGEATMTLSHIAAQLAVLGIEVMPWEATVLRKLSHAWLRMKDAGRKPDCPPPFGGVEQIPERTSVSQKIRLVRAGANVRRVKRSELAVRR